MEGPIFDALKGNFTFDYYFVSGTMIPIDALRNLGRIIEDGKAANDLDVEAEVAAMEWLRKFGFVMEWVPDPKAEYRYSPTQELQIIVCKR
ncbi:hypothetical protein C0995_012626 [Termitomyces sp. Mi166|nr:hypothetical protein C0995_012626 [Termitomyces sp. Mi166\